MDKKKNTDETPLKEGAKKSVGAILLNPVIAVVVFVLLLIAIITNFIQVIFTYLGYDSCGNYVKDSVKIEAENLTEGVEDIFSSASYRTYIDDACFKYDGSLYSVTGMELPAKGSGSKSYRDMEADYVADSSENESEYYIYDGYDVQNEYDQFWESAYIKYLVPFIQDKMGTPVIKAIQQKNSGKYKDCVIKLAKAVGKCNWFTMKKEKDTCWIDKITITVLKSEADAILAGQMKASQAVPINRTEEKITDPSDEMVAGAKASPIVAGEIIEMEDGESGGNTADAPDLFMDNGQTVDANAFTNSNRSVTQYQVLSVSYVHVKKHYMVKMGDPDVYSVNSNSYSYKKVTDEDTLELVHKILQDLHEGKYGYAVLDAAKGAVNSLWNRVKKSFQKDYSWRELTDKTNYILTDENGNIIADGDYIPIGDISFPEGEEGNTLMLATLVMAEAENQGEEGQVAVAYVVLNRMKQQGLSMHDVIYAPGQFACTWLGRFDKCAAQLSSMSQEQRQSHPCYRAAAAALSGQANNPIGEMTYFMVPSEASKRRIYAHNAPSEIKVIRDHWFYMHW